MDVLIVYVCGEETTLYLFRSPEPELKDELLSYHNYQVDGSDPDQDDELGELLDTGHAIYSDNLAVGGRNSTYYHIGPVEIVVCKAIVSYCKQSP